MTLFILLLLTLASSVIQFWLVFTSLQKRLPGIVAFRLLITISGLWSLISAANLYQEIIQINAASMDTFLDYLYQGIAGFMPVTFLALALRLTLPARYARNRYVLGLIYVVPVSSLFLLTGLGLQPGPAGEQIFADYWLPAHEAYVLFAELLGVGLALRQVWLAKSPEAARRYTGLAISGLIPVATELVQVFVLAVSATWTPELTPIASGVAAIVAARVVFRLNLLDVVPVAYERIVLNMTEGVIVLDQTGQITACNPVVGDLLEVDPETCLIGHGLDTIFDELPEVLDTLAQEDARPQRFNYRDRVLEIYASPLLDERHTRLGALLMLRDISQQIEQEETRLRLELDHQQLDLIREFIGDLSHDFFTSLTVINTYTALAERLSSGDKQSEYIARTREHAGRIENMLKNMLTIVKLEQQGAYPPDFDRTALKGVLQKTLQKLQPAARQKQVRLETHFPAFGYEVLCDPQQLELAIGNVLDNAIRHSPNAGTVSITLRADLAGQQVFIDIEDAGEGIAPQDLPHIFDRFYRGEKHRPATAASGLGLSITRQVLEAHRGTVTVRSQPGQGATFTLALPLADPELIVY